MEAKAKDDGDRQQWVVFENPISFFSQAENAYAKADQQQSSNDGTSERTPLRLVSWNLLADDENYSLSPKHGYCPIEWRVWKHDDDFSAPTESTVTSRLDRTVNKIRDELAPDLLCVQECLPHMFEDLDQRLSDYEGFHMDHHLVTTTEELVKDIESRASPCRNVAERSPTQPGATSVATTNSETRTLPSVRDRRKKKEAVLDNAIFIRRDVISTSSCPPGTKDDHQNVYRSKRLKLLWARAGLFKDFAELLPATGASKLTGKARKRLLSLDADGFLIVKLQTCSPDDGSMPVDLFVVCTHLHWNPHDAQVKAVQAELLLHVVHLCATGKQPTTAQSEDLHGMKTKTKRKSSSVESEVSKIPNLDLTNKELQVPPPCAVIIGGDFNSIPRFQPEFLPTKEEHENLFNLVRGTKRGDGQSSLDLGEIEDFSVEDLPVRFQESGAFRLLIHGLLESDHPDHPDTFGRGKATNTKKIKRCGSLSVPALSIFSRPNNHAGLKLAYPYLHNSNAQTQERSTGHSSTNEGLEQRAQNSLWPTKTTNVGDFEGVLDYVLWTESLGDRDCHLNLIQQTGVLLVPPIPNPIPDENHSSDHLPVGMSFDLRVSVTSTLENVDSNN